VYNNIKGSLCIKDIMTSGKYFNRAVMALDAPHIGHVVVETDDKIVVFGGGKDRYDISISEIQTTGRNVLIGLNLKYKVSREAPLPTHRRVPWATPDTEIDLAAYEEYPKSLFNKAVRAKNEDRVGYVAKETDDKIMVFGDRDYRYDIPKSKIIAVGRNIIVDMDFPDIFNYKVDRNAPLPTGESP
jgi:sporulation protein YlmC with PRC-barrel domain